MSAFDLAIQRKFAEVELERDQMHPYQDEALEFLRQNPFSALFIDMGLGKTVTSATLIVELLSEFVTTEKVLVVGPLRVMTDTWPNEFVKWRHLAPFNFTLIREDDSDPRIRAAQAIDRKWAEDRAWDRDLLKAQGLEEAEILKRLGATAEVKARHQIRAELARSKTGIHFINREQLEWLVNLHREKWPYRIVFIDESSSFKDHRTERFKALKKVRQTPGLITRMHLLTATPAAETYEHLFAQMYLLDLGKRLGKNITRYREEFFTYNKWSMKWKLRPNAEPQILDRIKDICLVMKAEDYLDIEKPHIVPRYIQLPQAAMTFYETMAKEMVVTIEDGTQIEAENAAALSSKLLQIASGVLYETQLLKDWDTEDMTKVKKVHRVHDAKIETLREIYEGLEGNPVLVVYHFKASVHRLMKAFPKAVVMDKEAKCAKKWNTGQIPMLLVHPQSAGHGLNLQAGGHNMVFFDLPWSLENYLQVIGRLARQGQKNPVIVQVLLGKATLDEAVFAALQAKEDAQEQLFLLLKKMIRKLRAKTCQPPL